VTFDIGEGAGASDPICPEVEIGAPGVDVDVRTANLGIGAAPGFGDTAEAVPTPAFPRNDGSPGFGGFGMPPVMAPGPFGGCAAAVVPPAAGGGGGGGGSKARVGLVGLPPSFGIIVLFLTTGCKAGVMECVNRWRVRF